MLPGLPVSTKCLTTPCIVRNGPRTLVLKCRSQSSRLLSKRVPRSEVAAEFTRPLMPPKCFRAVSTSLRQSPALEMSASTNNQSAPRARTVSAASLPFPAFRPLMTIPSAPSYASLLAIAKALSSASNYRNSRSILKKKLAIPVQFAVGLELNSFPSM